MQAVVQHLFICAGSSLDVARPSIQTNVTGPHMRAGAAMAAMQDASARAFPPTTLGRAVYDSGLPHAAARRLHGALRGVNGALRAASHPLHLIALLLISTGVAVEVADWQMWARVLKARVPPAAMDVAGAEPPPHCDHLCCLRASLYLYLYIYIERVLSLNRLQQVAD